MSTIPVTQSTLSSGKSFRSVPPPAIKPSPVRQYERSVRSLANLNLHQPVDPSGLGFMSGPLNHEALVARFFAATRGRAAGTLFHKR